MKTVLLFHSQSAAIMAAAAFIQKHKRCNAITYHALTNFSVERETITDILQLAGSSAEVTVLPNSSLTPSSPDYVLCLHNTCLSAARAYKSPSLVFDYHFPIETDTPPAKQTEILNDMKQYLERFCKMYLNEFM